MERIEAIISVVIIEKTCNRLFNGLKNQYNAKTKSPQFY